MKKILLCFLVAIVISCTSDNSGVLGELVVEDNLGSDVIEIGEGSENEQKETSETAKVKFFSFSHCFAPVFLAGP